MTHRLRRSLSVVCALVVLGLLAAGVTAGAAERALADTNAVPHLNEHGRQEYRKFLRAEAHRAFVIAPGGAWAWRSGASSAEAALAAARETCNEHSEQTCVPYAVDSRVVFDGKTWPSLWGPYKSAADAAEVAQGTRRGERFPDLALTDPDGKPFRVSNLRGKVVVLHFWGTWCPSCVHELPQFEKLRAALNGSSEVVFVFSQVRESAAESRRWLERQGLRLPLYDSGSRGGADDRLRLSDGSLVADRVLAPGFPTTYVLDRHGIVVFSLHGSAPDWSQYVAFLRDLAVQTAK